jgi:hypothetical protein
MGVLTGSVFPAYLYLIAMAGGSFFRSQRVYFRLAERAFRGNFGEFIGILLENPFIAQGIIGGSRDARNVLPVIVIAVGQVCKGIERPAK